MAEETSTQPRHKVIVWYNYVLKNGTSGSGHIYVEGIVDIRTQAQIEYIEEHLRATYAKESLELASLSITNWRPLEG